MARPLLSLVLVFVGLVALGWAVGDVTGWWSMQAIVGDAIVSTVGGVVDVVVQGAQDVADWFIDRLADALNPV